MTRYAIEVVPLKHGAYQVYLQQDGKRAYYMGALFRMAQGSWWVVSPGRHPQHHDSRPNALLQMKRNLPANVQGLMHQAEAQQVTA